MYHKITHLACAQIQTVRQAQHERKLVSIK
jgi:hypothetical protein